MGDAGVQLPSELIMDACADVARGRARPHQRAACHPRTPEGPGQGNELDNVCHHCCASAKSAGGVLVHVNSIWMSPSCAAELCVLTD